MDWMKFYMSDNHILQFGIKNQMAKLIEKIYYNMENSGKFVQEAS